MRGRLLLGALIFALLLLALVGTVVRLGRAAAG